MQVLDKCNNFKKLSKTKFQDKLLLGTLFVKQQISFYNHSIHNSGYLIDQTN